MVAAAGSGQGDCEAGEEREEARPVVEAAKVAGFDERGGAGGAGDDDSVDAGVCVCAGERVSAKRLVDIGDHVKKGQLLAVIEAPDLDAQVAQARQQVMQAERQLDQQRSQLALATVTVERYRVLVAEGCVFAAGWGYAGGELCVVGGECAGGAEERGCVQGESGASDCAAEL